MSNTPLNCSVLEIFLGILTGLIWLLLAVLGVVGDLLALIGIVGTLANIVVIIIALLGFLAVLLLGYCILRRVWRCCFGRNC
jgi:hypothetical protein